MVQVNKKHNSGPQNSDLVRQYAESPEMQQQLYRKTLWIVVFSQIMGGAGLTAGITVGALLAQDMFGDANFAGVPTALFTLGAAGGAYYIGKLSQKFGRRPGLATGFFVGGVGAVGVVLSAVADNLVLLLISLLFYGGGTATNLLARYAGTDLASSEQRGKAISIAMVGTTFGAFAGPNLVVVMGRFAESISIPALAGPFILAAAAYFAAALVLVSFLRPDPLIIAKAVAEKKVQDDKASNKAAAAAPAINSRGVFLGATVMVIVQMVMVAIMTMTPVHMGHHGHSLSAMGMVISIHITAMYLPSLLTGVLVDRISRMAMVVAAGATLLSAGIIAAIAPGDSLPMLILALALLGLGWNFGLISGTALIVDSTLPEARAKTQGTVDVLVALSGAAGGMLSGMVVAGFSFGILSLGGGFLALLLIPVVVWSLGNSKTKAVGPS
ncbi:MFS transporter [Metaplanococcus flavidus]|uniref:MFS transporter n=1 Tax=Metaplanococcus flavidus TaxID=569883 RepID=A0ABW3LFA9_9BACL